MGVSATASGAGTAGTKRNNMFLSVGRKNPPVGTFWKGLDCEHLDFRPLCFLCLCNIINVIDSRHSYIFSFISAQDLKILINLTCYLHVNILGFLVVHYSFKIGSHSNFVAQCFCYIAQCYVLHRFGGI